MSQAIDWEKRGKDDAKKLAMNLATFVNYMARESASNHFVDRVMREHRTLQQSIFSLFLKTIEKWSKQEHFDLRNEFTIEKSKEIMKLFPCGSNTPFI